MSFMFVVVLSYILAFDYKYCALDTGIFLYRRKRMTLR